MSLFTNAKIRDSHSQRRRRFLLKHQSFVILILDGNYWGKLVPLSTKLPNKNLRGNEYTFGRLVSNSIVLHDIRYGTTDMVIYYYRLSGRHAKLSKESDGKVYLTDLSTNGTFLEDSKVCIKVLYRNICLYFFQ